MRQLSGESLWMGHYGDALDVRRLLDLGVAAVVDLALNERPAVLPRELVYCRFPIIDGEGNPPWLLRLAVSTVADLLRTKTPTLVYCSAGMSRTPVIVASALAGVRRCSLHDALTIVAAGGPMDVSPGLYREAASLRWEAS